MWFYHWYEVINELLKKFGLGLTTFVLLFAQAVPRFYPMPIIKSSIWCLEEKWNSFRS